MTESGMSNLCGSASNSPASAPTATRCSARAWIDVRSKGWANPVAEFEAGGVGLSDGADFGLPGYVRLNFGCPLPQLEEALARMVAVWEKPHQ